MTLCTDKSSRPGTSASKRSKSPQSNVETLIQTDHQAHVVPHEKDLKPIKKPIPVVVSGTRKGKKVSIVEAQYALDFMKKSPLLTTFRATHTKSLADWKLELQGKEKVWDPSAFSTTQFMADYIHKRETAAAIEAARTSYFFN
jgi:hypothetical protein